MLDIEEELESSTPCKTADEFVVRYEDTIKKAARKEHKGSMTFEPEDLEQEAWLSLLGNWEHCDSQGRGYVYEAAALSMRRYAAKERLAYEHFSGKFIYTPEVVRAQLELGAWSDDPEGDWAIRIDVREAWDSLGDRERDLVYRHYHDGEDIERGSSDRRAMERAVDKMTNTLNSGVAFQRIEILEA